MSIALTTIGETAISALDAARVPVKVPPKRRTVAIADEPLAPEPR
ncbi:MAG: hypothetical protein ABIP91_03595 [Sphingomicrobium sp.]